MKRNSERTREMQNKAIYKYQHSERGKMKTKEWYRKRREILLKDPVKYARWLKENRERNRKNLLKKKVITQKYN